MRFRMRDPPPSPPDRDVDRDFHVRHGCFVELGGASGHPDHLARRRANAAGSETYAFNLPDMHVADFARGAPVARLVGRVEVTCERTGLAATMDLKLPDADADPADRRRVERRRQRSRARRDGKQQGDAEQQGTTDSRRARVLRVLLGTLDGGVYSAAASDQEHSSVRTVCPPTWRAPRRARRRDGVGATRRDDASSTVARVRGRGTRG